MDYPKNRRSLMNARFTPLLAIIIIASPFGSSATDLKTKPSDFTWRFPPNHAAVFDEFDPRTGKKLGQYILFDYELPTGPAMNGGSDIPYKYVFRTPQLPERKGSRWRIEETLFADALGLLPPVRVIGTYQVKELGKRPLKKLFQASLSKDARGTSSHDTAVIEGHFQLFRCNWVNREARQAGSKPEALLSTLQVIRRSDNALLGARFTLRGRVNDFTKMGSAELPRKANDSRDLILLEPLLKLSKEMLSPRIDIAIESGVKWLKSQQQASGSISDRKGYPIATSGASGATALSILALLHSGLSPNDPAIVGAFNYLNSRPLNQSYDLALKLMALEAKYFPFQQLQNLKSYSEEKVREEIAKKISPVDKRLAQDAATRLMECQATSGVFGYTKGIDTPNLSSAQYCLLGLKSASRIGVKVPTIVWKRAADAIALSATASPTPATIAITQYTTDTSEYTIAPQDWAYELPKRPTAAGWNHTPTATMVTAAISSLALCVSELDRTKLLQREDRSRLTALIWGGFAWLKPRYSVRTNMPEGIWWGPSMEHYFRYSMERAFVLAGISRFEGHDWYLQGASLLIHSQMPDGRWEGNQDSPVVDTAFALLFLKKATIPIETLRPNVATGERSKD